MGWRLTRTAVVLATFGVLQSDFRGKVVDVERLCRITRLETNCDMLLALKLVFLAIDDLGNISRFVAFGALRDVTGTGATSRLED